MFIALALGSLRSVVVVDLYNHKAISKGVSRKVSMIIDILTIEVYEEVRFYRLLVR
jgi:energy-converting hydrogenase Eha subunit B